MVHDSVHDPSLTDSLALLLIVDMNEIGTGQSISLDDITTQCNTLGSGIFDVQAHVYPSRAEITHTRFTLSSYTTLHPLCIALLAATREVQVWPSGRVNYDADLELSTKEANYPFLSPSSLGLLFRAVSEARAALCSLFFISLNSRRFFILHLATGPWIQHTSTSTILCHPQPQPLSTISITGGRLTYESATT